MNKKKKDEEIPTVEQLQERLKELLKERPELQKLQDEIEKIAEEAGDDPDKRIKAINEFFVKHLRKTFIPEIKKISAASQKAKKQIKEMQEKTGCEEEVVKKKRTLH